MKKDNWNTDVGIQKGLSTLSDPLFVIAKELYVSSQGEISAKVAVTLAKSFLDVYEEEGCEIDG